MNNMTPEEVTEQINQVEESKTVDEKAREAEIIERLKRLQFRAIRQEEERSGQWK